LQVAPFAVARLALLTVLVPLVAGVVVHSAYARDRRANRPVLSLGPSCCWWLPPAALLAGVWRSVWEATGQGAVVLSPSLSSPASQSDICWEARTARLRWSWGCRVPAGIRQSPSRSPQRTSLISGSEEPSFSTCS
jgi:hypothetical protein